MNQRVKLFVLLLSLAGSGLWGGNALAAAKVATAAGGGTWATATWAPVGVPAAGDTCTITSGVNLTVGTAAVCGSLAIGTNTSTNTTLTLAASGSLNITSSGGQSGNLALNPNNRNATFTLAVATQTVTVDGAFTTSTTTGTHNITVSTGQINFTQAAGIAWPTRGTLTVTGNNAGGSANFAGPLTLGGGTLSNNGGTINFAGLVTQTGGTITNVTTAGTFSFSGGLNHSAGTFTTLLGETINFGGNYTNSGGTQTFATSSTENFTGAAIITPTTAIVFGNLVVNPGAGNTVALANNVTAAGILTVSSGTFDLATFTALRTATGGTLTIASGATMLLGASNYPTNYTTDTLDPNSTVNYDRNTGTAQTVTALTGAGYGNLTLSGSGQKTMTGVTAIGGNLNISGSATMTSNAAFTLIGALNYSSSGTTTLTAATPISIGSYNQTAGTFAAGANTVTVSGNWNETGSFTSTGTVTFNGTAAQTISGTVTFSTLNVTNATVPYNITLSTNVTVSTLTGTTVNLTPSCSPDYTLTSTVSPLGQVLHTCMQVSSMNYVSCTSTAATVQWTVIFTKSATGVDANAFSLVPTGLSGAFITTVTGSGTTWTVTANTGIGSGSGSLGLNQTGPGSVVPTLNGTFTGQVCTITSTPALAQYRMDEAYWNGTAGEVKDSSGSGNNAQAFNGANTAGVAGQEAKPGSPGTCRYGVFNGGYVQTPLPDLTTDFTITAWIRTTDNTAIGQRILIDDQSNSGGYGFSFNDEGAGVLRFYSRGITSMISLDSIYPIANNTWYFVAAVADITNKMRTIYVFNQSGVLQDTKTETPWTSGTWGTDSGPVSIGGETILSGEAALHFMGNLDEVRVYQKVLNPAALAAIATQSHTCATYVPDHLEIQHVSGTGVTCAASTLTIKACMDFACSTPYTYGVTGTLTNSGTPIVNWVGGTGFSIGVSGSVTKDVQVTTVGSTVFGTQAGTVSPVPSGTSPTCNFGSPWCTFTASDAGAFVVSVPSHRSCVAQAPTVTVPVACGTALDGTKSIGFRFAYVDPNTGATPTPHVPYAGLAAPGAPLATGTDASFNLTFSSRVATLPYFVYDDAGSLTLTASYAGSGADAGLSMTGTSPTFVVAPANFQFSGIPAAPLTAGQAFNATVTARNACATPAATPNFINQTVTITSSNPLPAIGNATAINTSLSGFSSGAAIASLTWNEVGTIDLNANLASYLGSVSVSGTQAAVGRFHPAYFDTVVTQGCGTSFTYAGSITPTKTGQPFTVTVTANKSGGGITKNYDGASYAYAYLTTLSNAGVTAGLANNTIAAASFANGVGSTNVTYAVATPQTAPLTLTLRAVDSDTPAVSSSGHTEGTTDIRSGRLRLQNANGSELLNLPLSLGLQYWAGASTGWQTNAADTCTLIAPANFAFSFPANAKNLLAACETTVSVSGSAPNYTVSLAKPGLGNNGWTDLTLNLGTAAGTQCTTVGVGAGPSATSVNAPWLQYNWTGTVDNPRARATFGVYKSGPVIFRREMY